MVASNASPTNRLVKPNVHSHADAIPFKIRRGHGRFSTTSTRSSIASAAYRRTGGSSSTVVSSMFQPLFAGWMLASP